jgi:hypothetical protein
MSDQPQSKFDQEQIAYLEPLAKANAIVRVPLFANTLPLGYHYAVARQKVHGTHDPKRACLIRWGLSSLMKLMEDASEMDAPAAFYCTRKYLTDLLGGTQDKALAGRIKYFPVTRYQPRWVFVRSNVPLRQAMAPHRRNSEVLFSSEVTQTLVENTEWCEVFSDTPDQARSLERYLSDVLSRDVRVIDPMTSDALEGPRRPHRALQLYYYSAPTSNVLLNDHRFIPLRLSEDVVNSEIADFETGVAIIPSRSGDDGVSEEIKLALTRYHEGLYLRCSAVQQEDWTDSFVDLTWVYNRLARAQRISDTFMSEQEFAKCLADHHVSPAPHVALTVPE